MRVPSECVTQVENDVGRRHHRRLSGDAADGSRDVRASNVFLETRKKEGNFYTVRGHFPFYHPLPIYVPSFSFSVASIGYNKRAKVSSSFERRDDVYCSTVCLMKRGRRDPFALFAAAAAEHSVLVSAVIKSSVSDK